MIVNDPVLRVRARAGRLAALGVITVSQSGALRAEPRAVRSSQRRDLAAARGRVPGDRAGAGLRRRGDGAVPVRRDDARHQRRRAARRASRATRLARLASSRLRGDLRRSSASSGLREASGSTSRKAWRRCPRVTATPSELGHLLYTEYLYPFELAAVLLLVAIVAAIALTMRKRPGLKVQDIGRAGGRAREDRVRLVKAWTRRRTRSQ
jgi:hypothetical protein